MSNTENPERFSLARWSRLKREAPGAAETAAKPPGASPPVPVEAKPVLPPIETLTIDSDFTAFMRADVDESVRRAAVKQLFRDPHFNAIDGLDVYIDDYARADPIPAAMLARLQEIAHEMEGLSTENCTAAPAPKSEAAAVETPSTNVDEDSPSESAAPNPQ